jgi:hypothetical protein
MTSFTRCLETSFTLPAREAHRGDGSDGLEDDGRTGTAGAICGRGDAKADIVCGVVRGLLDLASYGYLWLRRYRDHGVAGIAERSRKPHHSLRRTDSEHERR